MRDFGPDLRILGTALGILSGITYGHALAVADFQLVMHRKVDPIPESLSHTCLMVQCIGTIITLAGSVLSYLGNRTVREYLASQDAADKRVAFSNARERGQLRSVPVMK